jgi:hypothetical protein
MYPMTRDWLLVCVSPDGKEYMVDHNDQHCRQGDDSKSCILPGGKVIEVRIATDTCRNHGGIELGLHKTEGAP